MIKCFIIQFIDPGNSVLSFALYLPSMQAHLQLLNTIYLIASKDPKPLSYECRPRELILRVLEDWNTIHENIKLLEAEGLVSTKQLDTMIICLTEKGVEQAKNSAVIR